MGFVPKTIPTRYNGVNFRSRLEARWALFFDLLALDWHYELEGFQLPTDWYVPDFYVANWWVEIKPIDPMKREKQLMAELLVATEGVGCIFYGQIGGKVGKKEYGGDYIDVVYDHAGTYEFLRLSEARSLIDIEDFEDYGNGFCSKHSDLIASPFQDGDENRKVLNALKAALKFRFY